MQKRLHLYTQREANPISAQTPECMHMGAKGKRSMFQGVAVPGRLLLLPFRGIVESTCRTTCVLYTHLRRRDGKPHGDYTVVITMRRCGI